MISILNLVPLKKITNHIALVGQSGATNSL